MSDTPRTDQQAREWDDGFSMPSDLIALARDLERENAALRKDKERLDWLEEQSDSMGWLHQCRYSSIRSAIDAARKEAQP